MALFQVSSRNHRNDPGSSRTSSRSRHHENSIKTQTPLNRRKSKYLERPSFFQTHLSSSHIHTHTFSHLLTIYPITPFHALACKSRRKDSAAPSFVVTSPSPKDYWPVSPSSGSTLTQTTMAGAISTMLRTTAIIWCVSTWCRS